jgi:DNA-binding protein HU-beta
MNKTELIDRISSQTGLMKKDVDTIVNSIIDVTSNALADGDKLTMVGFGTFKVLSRKEKTGVNPKTGAKIKIPATKVPKFVAGKELKEKVK